MQCMGWSFAAEEVCKKRCMEKKLLEKEGRRKKEGKAGARQTSKEIGGRTGRTSRIRWGGLRRTSLESREVNSKIKNHRNHVDSGVGGGLRKSTFLYFWDASEEKIQRNSLYFVYILQESPLLSLWQSWETWLIGTFSTCRNSLGSHEYSFFVFWPFPLCIFPQA